MFYIVVWLSSSRRAYEILCSGNIKSVQLLYYYVAYRVTVYFGRVVCLSAVHMIRTDCDYFLFKER